MSWVTVIWSMTAAACLTLAAIYFLVWCRRRTELADLFFSFTAVGTAAYAYCELAMVLSATPAQFATALRWLHVPTWVIVVSLPGFVLSHLRAGRLWLAWAVFALRTLALLLNFVTGQNLNYREVTALRHIPFLSGTASLGVGVSNPWMLVGQLSLLFLVIFTVDAAITVWRRGDRRKALVTGGSIVFFSLAGLVQAILVLWRIVDLPLMASFCFLGIVVAMGYELSRETLRAAQLSADLRESESRLKLAADSAGAGLWSWDLKTNLIWATERARKLYEFSVDELISFEKFLSKLHPDDRAWVAKAAQAAAQEGADFHDDYRVVLPNGSVRWLEVQAKAVLTRWGKPERITGVSLDITEHRRSEEIHRNAQELMAAVFNSVPGLLYLYTEDGRLIQWNRQHEQMTGYSSEELLNFRAQDWFDERNWIEAAKTLAKVFSEGYAQTEVTMKLKNGQQMPIFATGSRLMIDGKPHMVGIALDISARKQAEEKFRLMTEAAPSGIVLADREGRMVLVNVRTETLFGYSREELIGQPVEMLMPERFRSGHAGHRVGFIASPEARAMGTGRELFARRKDGTEFPVEIGLSPIQGEQGTLILTVIVDITARRQSEQEILQQRNELAHLSRVNMLGELSGSLAHELNQPLTAILSNAQAAVRFLAHPQPDLKEVRDILTDIVSEDKRAGEVIRRLRLLLKKGELQPQLLNANDLVQEVLKLVRSDLVNQGVVAHTELALNPPVLHADRVSLQQVLINLVMNSCDAMAGMKGADREFTIRTELVGEDVVCVSVSDNGTGIAPEKLEQVFAPFYTTKAHGMGLGLSVCRTIIAAHSGELRAANNPGRGATFSFTLPVARKEHL
jgi:PAS domain S-box-containing protein